MSICEIVKTLNSTISVFLNTRSAYFLIQDCISLSTTSSDLCLKVGGRSAKFGVMVLKASMIDWG